MDLKRRLFETNDVATLPIRGEDIVSLYSINLIISVKVYLYVGTSLNTVATKKKN